MIRLEHFRKLDLSAVLILAILWSVIVYVITFYFPYVFEIILFSTALFAAFTALLIRKIGAVVLLFSLAGVVTFFIPIFGFLGFSKILVLFLTGAIFEISAYLFKKYSNLLIAGAVSNASMPWLMSLLSRSQLPVDINYALWNFAIVSSVLGLLGALAGLLIWYKVKNSKLVLKFEYE